MTKKEIDTKLEIAEILVKHLDCDTSKVLSPLYDYLQKQLSIQGVGCSDNKGVNELHKLLVKYHSAGEELIKRREAVNDVNDLNVIDLQIRTNKAFVEDIMQSAGALL